MEADKTIKCIVCDEVLTGKQTKFCSPECRKKDYNTTRKCISKTCAYCGEPYLAARKEQTFCSLSCATSSNNLGRKGEKAKNWRGGLIHRKDGYIEVYAPDHPMAHKDGYIYEHRLVEKNKHPFTFPSALPVHHLNGLKNDNRPENIKMIRSQSAHMKLHHQEG
ncbi:MAG: hypothetical protein PHF24_06805 [Syntrophomonas sp.]|nr:hypothetical protein [Syntrophomonas sp.]